ncbi:MAG: aldehyde dehydrogenase (NADP(+)) [Flammeovirgaceae bacterium]
MTTANDIEQQVLEVVNPATEQALDGAFRVHTISEIENAVQQAVKAFAAYRKLSGERRAAFLEAIAAEILALGDQLIVRAAAETGLPSMRIIGERGRTVNQLKAFASLIREGSWVEASIDRAQPNRTPLPKADIRKMAIPIGPVVVFTASNFPLAFSTAGGDTASALAAGNPVIVKAHPAHLGTNELVAQAIEKAANKTGMPQGVFASLVGQGFELGQTLVRHPAIKAVAFTGSFSGGKALFDVANQRTEPIPVFAEMSSINPVILLTSKLKEHHEQLAADLAQSITLGAGQFCTNPGLLIGLDRPEFHQFTEALSKHIEEAQGQTMLHRGIWENFEQGKAESLNQTGVSLLAESKNVDGNNQSKAALAQVFGSDFLRNPQLLHEVFGPYSLVITCQDQDELQKVLCALNGQLTCTFIGNDSDFEQHEALIAIAQDKAGRVLFNGVPTGVEVCDSMVHGGPFPATTDSRFTSVGMDAIKRFVRPFCWQNAPQAILPHELKDENSLGIWRKVDGSLSKEALS